MCGACAAPARQRSAHQGFCSVVRTRLVIFSSLICTNSENFAANFTSEQRLLGSVVEHSPSKRKVPSSILGEGSHGFILRAPAFFTPTTLSPSPSISNNATGSTVHTLAELTQVSDSIPEVGSIFFFFLFARICAWACPLPSPAGCIGLLGGLRCIGKQEIKSRIQTVHFIRKWRECQSDGYCSSDSEDAASSAGAAGTAGKATLRFASWRRQQELPRPHRCCCQ